MDKELYVSDYITQELIKLMNKKEFNKISITELCNKANVSRISFYRNFESKEDILLKYTDKITSEFIKNQKYKYSLNNRKEYIFELFSHLNNHKDYCSLLYKNNLIYIVKDIFDKYFFKTISDSSSKKEQYNHVFNAGGFYNMFEFWLKNGCTESPKELSEMFINLSN